jgi:carbamoyltransferase
MKKVIGINAFHGDSSACLVIDGKVICAFEEERLLRIKHWAGLPINSIKKCLEFANLNIEDIDAFAVSKDPNAKRFKKISFAIKNIFYLNKIISSRYQVGNKVISLSDQLKSEFNLSKINLYYIEHHLAHCASAVYASGFENCDVLSIDSLGDFTSTRLLTWSKESDFKTLSETTFPNSLGFFYTALTQYLGFIYFGDEYKVMGLAPYGNPTYLKEFRDIIYTKNGKVYLNQKYFIHSKEGISTKILEDNDPTPSLFYNEKELTKLIGPPRKLNEEINQKHKDIAKSVQVVCEEIIYKILNYLNSQTHNTNLCITGGVGQNSVANGKISEKTKYKNIFIPPAAHDSGTAIGAALECSKNLGCDVFAEYSAYLGGYYNLTNEELSSLKQMFTVKECDSEFNLLDYVTNKLKDGCVAGWFQGRSEYGPRALGNRSIIADPTNANMKDIINTKIKRRESFRPFAPSILLEDAEKFFDYFGPSPFMERVYRIKEEFWDNLPAITHVDGTGRLQTVTKKSNSLYYELIKLLGKKTGFPIILNTSFNENEPMVETPTEALNCFKRTDMDMLVINNIVIEKK